MARILFYPVARQLWISISLLVLLINCGGAPESAAISTSAVPTLGSTETGPLPTVSAPVTTPTASSKSDSPALRWLKGTPCQAPCWEQLTPGSSTITDTTIRLSQLDSIANTQYAPEQNSDPALIAWQWKKYANAGGSIYYYTKKPPFANPPLNVILSISLAFDRPLTLQDVITTYGEPSHIQLAADYNPTLGLVYYFSVAYLDKGFLLQMQTNDFSRKPILSSSTAFDYVIMFQPGTQGFDAAIEPFFPVRQPSQFLVAWEGFSTNINTYCRDIRPDAPKKACE